MYIKKISTPTLSGFFLCCFWARYLSFLSSMQIIKLFDETLYILEELEYVFVQKKHNIF